MLKIIKKKIFNFVKKYIKIYNNYLLEISDISFAKNNSLINKSKILNPIIIYNKAKNNISSKSFKYDNFLNEYDKIVNIWKKNNNLNIFKTVFLPSQQIIGSLGNYSPLFFFLKQFYKEDYNFKPTIIIPVQAKITNQYLLSFFLPYINLIYSEKIFYNFQEIIENTKVPLEISLPYNNVYYPWEIAINYIKQDNKISSFNYFKLPENDESYGYKILQNFGISKKDWFVVLHVREDGFNGMYSDDHNFRNADILDYELCINEIIKRGGKVVRAGDKTMKSIKNINQCYDYAHSEYKSDFMDIFLAAKCVFYIGTSSGPFTMATYFNKPILLTNYLSMAGIYEIDKNSIILPKTIVKENGDILDLKKLLSSSIMSLGSNTAYKENNLKIINNSPTELLTATKEMLNILIDSKPNKDFLKQNYMFKERVKDFEIFKQYKGLKILGNISISFISKYNI